VEPRISDRAGSHGVERMRAHVCGIVALDPSLLEQMFAVACYELLSWDRYVLLY
jgi:hypothetical protein